MGCGNNQSSQDSTVESKECSVLKVAQDCYFGFGPLGETGKQSKIKEACWAVTNFIMFIGTEYEPLVDYYLIYGFDALDRTDQEAKDHLTDFLVKQGIKEERAKTFKESFGSEHQENSDLYVSFYTKHRYSIQKMEATQNILDYIIDLKQYYSCPAPAI